MLRRLSSPMLFMGRLLGWYLRLFRAWEASIRCLKGMGPKWPNLSKSTEVSPSQTRSKQVSGELDKSSGDTDGQVSNLISSQWPRAWATASQWLVLWLERKSWINTKQSSLTLSEVGIFNVWSVWKFWG